MDVRSGRYASHLKNLQRMFCPDIQWEPHLDVSCVVLFRLGPRLLLTRSDQDVLWTFFLRPHPDVIGHPKMQSLILVRLGPDQNVLWTFHSGRSISDVQWTFVSRPDPDKSGKTLIRTTFRTSGGRPVPAGILPYTCHRYVYGNIR